MTNQDHPRAHPRGCPQTLPRDPRDFKAGGGPQLAVRHAQDAYGGAYEDAYGRACAVILTRAIAMGGLTRRGVAGARRSPDWMCPNMGSMPRSGARSGRLP